VADDLQLGRLTVGQLDAIDAQMDDPTVEDGLACQSFGLGQP
jgi:hypothetical protein